MTRSLTTTSVVSDDARLRILVVDDNEMTCLIIKAMLQDVYDVTIATSFDDAVRLAKDEPIDVALLDIALGEERTGVDLLRTLRSMPHYGSLPAIAFTAYALPDSRERFLEAGFNDYLGKPIRKDQLLETLLRVLLPRRSAARARAKKIQFRLPPPPETLSEVIQMLSREDLEPDLERLISVLQKDPVASTWTLRHVNSAYYGLRYKANNIERAVALLGFDPVCNLILTEVVTRRFLSFASPVARNIYEHIMQMNIATAVYSRGLAYHLSLRKPDLAFTAGLLHLLGRMSMLASDPEGYSSLWRAGKRGGLVPPSCDTEMQRYRTDHIRLGADLARQWQLSEELTTILRFHQDPDWVTTGTLADVVRVVATGRLAACSIYEPASIKEGALERQIDVLAKKHRRKADELQEIIDALDEEVGAFMESIR